MELISLSEHQVGNDRINTVSARELHKFLLVGSEYGHWIKRRVEDFGFTYGVDFTTSFLTVGEGGDGKIHHHLSLDMAKELSMVERNDKGREARRYFIDCERRLLAAAPRVPRTYAEALRLAADQAEELIHKTMQLEAAKPAVEFVERYVVAEGNKGVRQVAQLLNVPNERAFVDWLIESGFMYRLEGTLTPMANQRHTGRFVIKAGVSRTSEHAYNAAKFTPKGVEWIAGEWAKHLVRSTEPA